MKSEQKNGDVITTHFAASRKPRFFETDLTTAAGRSEDAWPPSCEGQSN